MNDPDRDYVEGELRSRGFAVEAIAERDEKTSDLLAELKSVRLFVEVKSRRVDNSLRKAMESVPVGASDSIATQVEKHNKVSAETRKANEQLKASASPSDYRLLWYRANRGPFVQAAHSQIISTLLGVRFVSTRQGLELPCFYASHADFHRYTDIDAAVVEEDGTLRLFTNEFSPRHDSFERSEARQALSQGMIAPDLREGERLGACCIVDGEEVDRGDDAAVLAYLREKYPDRGIQGFVERAAVTEMTTIDARAELENRRSQTHDPQ